MAESECQRDVEIERNGKEDEVHEIATVAVWYMKPMKVKKYNRSKKI